MSAPAHADHRHPRRRTATVGLVVGLTLAGCSTATSPTSDDTAAPAVTSGTPSSAATSGPASSGSTPTGASQTPRESSPTEASTLEAPESEPGAGAQDAFTTSPTQGGQAQGGGDLLPVEVRTGTHGDVTRVVVEFTGEDAPGWAASYVDAAVEQGRGEPIALDGDAVLSVSMRGLTMPESDEQTSAMVSGAVTPKDPGVTDLHLDPAFEGQAVLHIGLDEQYPYTVMTLPDPQRVVVDIRTGAR